jgi:hypothetical protein
MCMRTSMNALKDTQFCHLLRIKPWFFSHPAQRTVTILTELSWLN